MMRPTEHVQEVASAVAQAQEPLWDVGVEARARWLATAFAQLNDPNHEAHQALVHATIAASGLSAPMVLWALDTTLSTLEEASLLRLAAQASRPHPRAQRVPPGRLCAVLLSGNVCTAAARALALPLLFGWPVVAKASTRDGAFAQHLMQQLGRVNAELAGALSVLHFAPDDTAALDALLAQADAVSVYGSDRTLHKVRARTNVNASFVAHGHGLGLGWAGRAALASEASAEAAAEALALDIAAYDQRGCLSPHSVAVERGAPVSPERFAQLLFERGLAPLARRLPRGTLPLDAGSAQLSWRGQAAARGTLHEGDGFAVAFEPDAALRLSPGYRNVQVIAVEGPHALGPLSASLGVHLKCLGVAGADGSTDALEARTAHLAARCAPRICPAGTMQTPPGDALTDGVASSEGLVRWAELG